ncbi:MAG: hypothetical protein F6J93_30395 [Oscillatoria sp. SIO1A7]|nr:hypothetical protein [Oscillatoria sp. SIO1A7]
MTWHTIMGDRVLTGVEAKFYIEAVQNAFAVLNDEINDMNEEDSEDWCADMYPTGSTLFDRSSFNQKAVLVNFVLSALLKPEIPYPPLTHILEAAAYFPLVFVRSMVSSETEDDDFVNEYEPDAEYRYYYRKMLYLPFKEIILPWELESLEQEREDYEPDEFEKMLQAKQKFDYRCNVFGEWDNIIEFLADRIFWDRDWQIVSYHPQLLDGGNEITKMMGIDDDYLSNRLPKVSDEEAAKALAEIHAWNSETIS